MQQHRTTYEGFRNIWEAKCSCLEKSGVKSREADVLLWIELHQHKVKIEKILARGGKPTLKNDHEWFLLQAKNPENSENDRALWQRLADEVAVRINTGIKGATGDDTLF